MRVQHDHRIGMYATKKIRPGEEIFFHYGDHHHIIVGQSSGKTVQRSAEGKLPPHQSHSQAQPKHRGRNKRKVEAESTRMFRWSWCQVDRD